MTLAPDELRALLWQRRKTILGVTVIFMLLAWFALWALTPEYTVTMIVGPTSTTGTAAMGARGSDSETAPSLAEHRDSEGLSDYTRYLQLLSSTDSAAQLIESTPGVLQTLFRPEWDAARRRWHFPKSFSSYLRETARFIFNQPGWRAPDEARLANYLKQRLIITPLAGSPMRKISFRHADKGLAINIVLGLHKAADAILRSEASRRSDAIIDYVTAQMPRVGVAEHRSALTRLLAEQERIRLLIAVNLPYAADIIQPPEAPAAPDWPNPVLLMIFGFLSGMMTGSVLVIAQHMIIRKKPDRLLSVVRPIKKDAA